MIHRELGDEVHLARERRALPSLLAADEDLLAVASAARIGNTGILAITDRRLIFLYVRRFLGGLKTREFSYRRVKAIDIEGRSGEGFTVRLDQPRRRTMIVVLADRERVAELATCARSAIARFDFHAD